MKKFIRTLALFLIIPVVIVLCFDVYLRGADTLYTEKYKGLMKNAEKSEVLFLGNSHANYAISPLHFRDFNIYNLANVNQAIYFDKRLTIKSINEGAKNLKYVFISVDYHSLFTSSQGVRNVWSYYANGIKYKDQNYLKEQISPFIWGYTPKVSLSLILKDILRRLTYSQSVISYDVEKGVNITDSLCLGFIGREGVDQSSFSDEQYHKRATVFKENIQNSDRSAVIEDLGTFIKFLQNENIEPILFSSPTYTKYNSYLDQQQIQRNKADINKICHEFNIEYWRFNEDSRFLKEDFYDMDHLNKEGAEKFSYILNNKLHLNYLKY